MSVFPGALPPASSANASDTLAVAGHTALHNNDRDEIRALATKVGTGASTPSAGKVLRGTGVGTSAYGQVDLTNDVTGALPVANGGTGVTTLNDLRQLVLPAVYPVGSIYTNANDSTNPGTLFGFGTWVAFGQGRVMVGLNGSDTDFDTAEETGGAKTVSHSHVLSSNGRAQIAIDAGNTWINLSGVSSWTATNSTASTVWGGSSSSKSGGATLEGATDTSSPSVVQPYITVYMWKRVS